jgi:hypothetical protein
VTKQLAHVRERLERHHLRNFDRPGQRRRPGWALCQRGHLETNALHLFLLVARCLDDTALSSPDSPIKKYFNAKPRSQALKGAPHFRQVNPSLFICGAAEARTNLYDALQFGQLNGVDFCPR